MAAVREALSPAPSPPRSGSSMNYIGRIITNVREFCNEINSATLTGAIDVVVIEQPDGSFATSPFHVRFGKIGVLRSREKIVDIEINGKPVNIHMKLGESGEAFFVEEVTEESSCIIGFIACLNPVAVRVAFLLLTNFPLSLHPPPFPSTQTGPSSNVPGHVASSRLPRHWRGAKQAESDAQPANEQWQQAATTATEGPPQAATDTSVAIDIDAGATTDTGDELPTITGTTPATPIPLVSSSEPSRRLSTSRIHKPSPILATSSPLHRPQESIGVQTEPAITGCEDDEEDRLVIEPEPTEVATVAAAVTTTMTTTEEESTKHDQPQMGKRRRKKKHPIRRRSRFNEDPHSRMSTPAASEEQDIFQMDSDFEEERTAIGATRPSSPKSDTEYENQMMDANSQTVENTISWTWGELPHIPNASRFSQEEISAASAAMSSRRLSRDVVQDSKHLGPLSSDEEDAHDKIGGEGGKHSVLGGVLSFMKPTKKQKEDAAAVKDGIFLDDLDPSELDPEVAALYFPKFRSALSPRNKDDDAESGNGPSLSQSPNSDPGAAHMATLHCLDSDTEERHAVFDLCRHKYSDLAMSLCGGLPDWDKSVMEEKFAHFLVTYDQFCENPEVLNNPDLVVRMGGKYYNWGAIAPHLLSLAMFQRPLPEKTLDKLADIHMPKKKKKSTYSWWSWGRAGAKPDGVEKAGSQHSDENLGVSDGSEGLDVGPKGVDVVAACTDEVLLIEPPPPPQHPTSLGKIEVTPECKEEHYASTSSDAETSDTATHQVPSGPEYRKPVREKRSYFCDKFKKSLRLSSDEIEVWIGGFSARRDGRVLDNVTTAYQGTTRCMCHIYLWRHDDKIVISDIDGTITKSDVLGHIMPILGRDWAQSGVAKLFTKIHANGYQFLYLSARAIGQAHLTREYLRSVRQGDLWLPDGPLLLSPTSLINAFHKEVIEKKPEEFKISCLRDIQTLFNVTGNPFYAGFGNKINDTLAYRAVGIPVSRIFTINPKGELKLELMHNFLSSYHCLSDVVDHVFPPLHGGPESGLYGGQCFSACEEFSSFTYWRDPIAPVEITIEEPKKPPAKG
ncbi:hypothetical protein HPB48_017746 [Haemaphysalis longicornis]|uniref:phosphatidate phosphatase n=1 Tax=Haemaphysalis longicornis TaxID=44386 RepID=A0A9J6GMB9_HAELO|nr:hypothetical protein HPB48_017746 [Haemaphysalis longicornis]